MVLSTFVPGPPRLHVILAIGRFFKRQKLETLSRKELEALADEALMLRYGQGDVQSFDVLLRRHERGVFNFIYRSVRHRERAEELSQDVFLRVVRNAARYKETAKFTTWLYTIARNICIDESRKRKKRGPELSLDAPIGDDPDSTTYKDRVVDADAKSGASSVSRDEFRTRLVGALDELPDEQREVFVLRHFEGLKFTEIAEIQGVTDNTVKSRMRYAMQTLRGYLAEFEGHSFDADENDEVGDA